MRKGAARSVFHQPNAEVALKTSAMNVGFLRSVAPAFHRADDDCINCIDVSNKNVVHAAVRSHRKSTC